MSKESLEPAFQTMLPISTVLGWGSLCFSRYRKSCDKQEGRLPFEVWVTSWDFWYFFLFNEGNCTFLCSYFFALFGVKMVFMLLTNMCCIASLFLVLFEGFWHSHSGALGMQFVVYIKMVAQPVKHVAFNLHSASASTLVYFSLWSARELSYWCWSMQLE